MVSVVRGVHAVTPKLVAKRAALRKPRPSDNTGVAPNLRCFREDQVRRRGKRRLKRNVFDGASGLLGVVRASGCDGSPLFGIPDHLLEVLRQTPYPRSQTTAGPLHQGRLQQFSQHHSEFVDFAPSGRRWNPRLVTVSSNQHRQVMGEVFDSLHPVSQVFAARSIGAPGFMQHRPDGQEKRDEGAGALDPSGEAAVGFDPRQSAVYRWAGHRPNNITVPRRAERVIL